MQRDEEVGRPSPSDLSADLERIVALYLDPDSEIRQAEFPVPRIDRPRLNRDCVCASTNRYVIRERIGEGGMGIVYRAYDEKLKRDVALKVLVSPEEDSLERFIREQEITACLDHPSFVRVLAIGYVTLDDRSVPFYAMPLIRGWTLEKLILRRRIPDAEGARLRREFTLPSLLRMLAQLCLTLQSAHDKNIIHRDLKPSNILVGPYGDVYVTDLGLAKFLIPDADETRRFDTHVLEQLSNAQGSDATPEAMMGTPYYMAPEQSLAPHEVGPRADIFGLGAILYFMLTGRRPQYLEPFLNAGMLEGRKAELLQELRARSESAPGVAVLLEQPRKGLPSDTRALVEEYQEVLELIQGAPHQKFRYVMKQCVILPPSEVVGEGEPIDPALERLCMKAMARNPRNRFSSCREFWDALRQYAESAVA